MPDNSNDIQSLEPIAGRGGARQGAGRPKRDSVQAQRWMAARGINPLHASEILAHVADERTTWKRILSSDDDRVVLSAMMFLVSMRDGKPAQQINVTSQSVTVSVDDIAKARAIVRELTGPHAYPNNPDGTSRDNGDNPHQLSGDSLDVRREEKAKPLMLSGADGGKNGGEVGNGKVIE